MKYAAIEGGCYAGKTTTIDYLTTRGASALVELRNQDGRPRVVAWRPGLEGYKAKIDAFLKAEERRTEKIDTLRSDPDSLLVADRSILSTVLAAQDFGLRFGLGNPEDRNRAFEYGVERLTKAQAAGRIVLPDCVLVLTLTDSNTFYKRLAARGPDEVPGPPFLEYEPNCLLAERTYAYATAIWGDSAAIMEIGDKDQKEAIGAAALHILQALPAAEWPLPLPSRLLPG